MSAMHNDGSNTTNSSTTSASNSTATSTSNSSSQSATNSSGQQVKRELHRRRICIESQVLEYKCCIYVFVACSRTTIQHTSPNGTRWDAIPSWYAHWPR